MVHLDGLDLSPPRRRCCPRIDRTFGGLRGLRVRQLASERLGGVREVGESDALIESRRPTRGSLLAG